GQFLPRVDFFANFGVSGAGLASGSSDYAFGAKVTFNLFDAGRKARIGQAVAATSAASAEKDRLADQIRLEVVTAYQQFISARERLVVASKVIAQAEETLRIVRDRYQEGLTTVTEVLRSETTGVRARVNLLAVRYDYYVSYAGLLIAAGSLNDVAAFVK
ncbi:MAG TPA: TolC family protein, partial [Blastocatellia bacterium]|nr:TolC family protein [Blastocatellia bacterium]